MSELISRLGTAKLAASPNAYLDITVAVTADRITGTKLVMAYSIITTSIAKITPAIGVLNDPAIAAAVLGRAEVNRRPFAPSGQATCERDSPAEELHQRVL